MSPRRAPQIAVIVVLADLIGEERLEAIRAAIGDAADDSTREQLVVALGTVLETHDLPIVRLVLASVAAGDAEATDICAHCSPRMSASRRPRRTQVRAPSCGWP